MQIFQQADTVLGSEAVLTLCADSEKIAQALFDALWQQIREFDTRFSRFRLDSELTAVNQAAGQQTHVSDEFMALVMVSKRLSEATAGKYNPFILPALQRSGYMASFAPTVLTKNPPDYRNRRVGAINELELSEATIRIPADTALDFGGIGKGYLLDQLGAFLTNEGYENFWLSLGGDILVSGKQPDATAWGMDIADALNPSQPIAVVSQEQQAPYAIATSGVTKRKGLHNGKNWHHIIDPETGEPVKTDALTATVIMPTATLADVYATLIVAAGSKEFADIAKQHMIETTLLQTAENAYLRGEGLRLL